MNLWNDLFGGEEPRCVAFVGAGGKTSAVKRLAAELSACGRRVVVTTTTKMHPPTQAGLFCSSAEQARALLDAGLVAWAGVYFNEFKMQGVPGALPALCEMADCVLIEADGARKHPLKMIDRAYEPQIPPEADAVVAVAGMDGVGLRVEQAVHRPQLACEALGVTPDHIVTPADTARLLRLCYEPRLVLLNKADDPQKRAAAEAVARELMEAKCVITSLRDVPE